jgi:hypothetical protein
MTLLSVPLDLGVAVAGEEPVTGPGAVSGACAARGSCSSSLGAVPDDRRRRRLLEGPLARSGLAAEAGGAATGGGSGSCAPFAPRRRRLRRDDVAGTAAAGAAASWGRCRPSDPRLTLAPTSPSAHSVPSTVWTSTRQTTIADGAPPTGGRFWVSVQRAKIVSPARTGRGNFQFSHSHSSTDGTGMSIDPRPTAMATTRAGGAERVPWSASMVSGEKSPATPAKSATSASEMVRLRVVHSPPRGRSSKESGSRSGRV